MLNSCVSPPSSAQHLEEPLLAGSAGEAECFPNRLIDRQLTRYNGTPLLGVLVRHPIGRFFAEGLDKPLGVAVGDMRVRIGSDVPET